MDWLQITSDDVKQRFSSDELEKLQTLGMSDGQADPLPGVISEVTDEARGYVAARAGNVLGPSGTIPPQVRAACVSIIIWRLAGRLAIGGAERLLRSETRQQDYQDALQFLKDVAAGKIKVDQPKTPEEVSDETIESEEGKAGSNPFVDFNV